MDLGAARAPLVERHLLELWPAGEVPQPRTAVIVPHAGWIYSGAVAARTLARTLIPGLVVLLGVNHRARGAALASWGDGSWETPLRLVLRPLTASLAAVWLVGTTPYPDLFAPLSRVLPRATGDGLFLTYRALFALLARAERLWRALRLRGGLSGASRIGFVFQSSRIE